MSLLTDEYLSIESIDFATHAYWIESLAPLFNVTKVGTDRDLPGLPGVRPYRRKTTRLSVSLVVHVIGDVDVDGVPSTDPRATLYEHLRAIEAAVLVDVATVPGTLTAVWSEPSGERTAEVTVEGWTVRPDGYASATCTLDLSIPNGWTVTGS